MEDDLVTAAVFGDHTQAVAARIHLQEVGVPAFLQDELVSQALFVAGPVGGVKLQVPTSRLEEAIRLIDERMPGRAAPVNWSEVDVGEPEPDEPAQDGDAAPQTVRQSPPPAAVEETEPSDLTLRERLADRIVRGTLLGLLFWPVFILAVWRLVQIANSTERLRPEYQRKANVAAVIIGSTLLLVALFCCGVSLQELRR